MIYQHRLVVARSGKLDKRHEGFQSTSMPAYEAAGSVLVGAWEICIGRDAGSALWQLRQFESLAFWEAYQVKLRADRQLTQARAKALYPINDEINTSILERAGVSPPLPANWPSMDDVKGRLRGYIEQRTMRFRPGLSEDHHQFYQSHIMPALAMEGVELIGLFDTLIGTGAAGPGPTMQSVELRRFADMATWQVWRERQETDVALGKLVRQDWLGKMVDMRTELLRPMDYSRIR
ncbi:MAG: hypothetical protein ACK5JT_22030 [Hyphomicrobiaceae bacterium]